MDVPIRNDGSNWVKFLSGGCFLFEKKKIFSPQFDKCPTALLKNEIILLISSDKNMILSLAKSKFFQNCNSVITYQFIISHLKKLPYIIY